MEKLNEFEIAVLNRLADKYLTLKVHLPFLEVKDRKITGVGMYVDFSYRNEPIDLKPIEPSTGALSTNDNIEIKGLEFGLGFELNITDGKIIFMEFITYGERWDGKTKNFTFK